MLLYKISSSVTKIRNSYQPPEILIDHEMMPYLHNKIFKFYNLKEIWLNIVLRSVISDWFHYVMSHFVKILVT